MEKFRGKGRNSGENVEIQGKREKFKEKGRNSGKK
jgi:hypothetical protein